MAHHLASLYWTLDILDYFIPIVVVALSTVQTGILRVLSVIGNAVTCSYNIPITIAVWLDILDCFLPIVCPHYTVCLISSFFATPP